MTRILWFHPRPLAPATNGGDLRTQGLVAAAVTLGHEVLLVHPAGGDASGLDPALAQVAYERPRGPAFVATKALSASPLRSPRITRRSRIATAAAVGEFDPQVAVVSEVMSWSVARRLVPPMVPLVYDAHNDETLLFAQLHAGARGPVDRTTFSVDESRVARAEAALLRRAAVVAAVSPEDAVTLGARRPGGPVVVVPSTVPLADEPADPATAGPVVLFVATLDYAPNVAALHSLVTEVLPSVAARQPLTLLVVGRRPGRSVRDLADATPWIELHPDPPDVGPFYRRARCAVLPIRAGGGTKLKVLEALSHGLPVVATPEAVSGIAVSDGEGVLIRAGVAELAAEAGRLLSDAQVAAALGRAGRDVFVRTLSDESTRPSLARVLDLAVESVQAE